MHKNKEEIKLREPQNLVDRSLQIALSKWTKGVSPAALSLAFYDWYLHFISHPAKQAELWKLYQDNSLRLLKLYTHQFTHPEEKQEESHPLFFDKRFASESWQKFPFKFMYETFLLINKTWHAATTNVPGVTKHHEDVVSFIVRQILDMLSPSNSPFLNPDVMQVTQKQKGENFVRGLENFVDDALVIFIGGATHIPTLIQDGSKIDPGIHGRVNNAASIYLGASRENEYQKNYMYVNSDDNVSGTFNYYVGTNSKNLYKECFDRCDSFADKVKLLTTLLHNSFESYLQLNDDLPSFLQININHILQAYNTSSDSNYEFEEINKLFKNIVNHVAKENIKLKAEKSQNNTSFSYLTSFLNFNFFKKPTISAPHSAHFYSIASVGRAIAFDIQDKPSLTLNE